LPSNQMKPSRWSKGVVAMSCSSRFLVPADDAHHRRRCPSSSGFWRIIVARRCGPAAFIRFAPEG